MVKKSNLILCIGIISLLTIPLILAGGFDTDISIQLDETNQSILIRLKDINSGSVFDSLSLKTNSEGEASGNFSTSREEINILILLVKEGQIIRTESVGPFVSGNQIDLDFRENPINETLEENTTEINETEEILIPESEAVEEVVAEGTVEEDVDARITGAAVTDTDSTFDIPSYLYYIIGGVLLLSLVAFLAVKIGGRAGHERSFTPVISGELLTAEKKLLKAEKELREVKAEIDSIKNKKSEVSEAEKAYKEAKEKLERLKGKVEED